MLARVHAFILQCHQFSSKMYFFY